MRNGHTGKFDGSQGADVLLSRHTQLETGFVSSENGADYNVDLSSSSPTQPIFQLGRVQYAFPAPLAHLTVASNILTMCLYAYPSGPVLPQNLPPPPHLVRINLDEPERTLEADVPLGPPARNNARGQGGQALPLDASSLGPHKMFADPSGRHLVLSMRSGDNYYWASGWKKARLLPKWKGTVVESIAWHPRASSSSSSSSRSSSTREILVGSRSGSIFEAVLVPPATNPDDDESQGDFLDRLARRTAGAASSSIGVGGSGSEIDRVFRTLFTLSEPQAISGLTVTHFGGGTGGGRTKAAVVATTSTRIYEFVGGMGKEQGRKDEGNEAVSAYAKVFEPYKGTVPNLSECSATKQTQQRLSQADLNHLRALSQNPSFPVPSLIPSCASGRPAASPAASPLQKPSPGLQVLAFTMDCSALLIKMSETVSSTAPICCHTRQWSMTTKKEEGLRMADETAKRSQRSRWA